MVRAARPDVPMMHFTHTPFCGPSSIRVLPTDVAIELCRSMATVPAGFHTQRWADAYAASVRTMLGLEAPAAGAFAAPLGPDADLLAESAAMPETRQFVMELDELVGDRALVVRVDRIDLSKNIVRGFLAYDRFLARYPEWRERVVFVAMLNRSRDTLAEYLAYQQEVEQAVARVNGRWSRPGWDPIVLDTRDSYTRSLAGFARYDVLFVNPVKDGLNLVAKEGPLVNERSGVLCLSPEAGAYEELAEAAVPVHPYDLEQDASALHEALTMTAAERARRADRLRELVGRHTPRSWLNTLTRHAR
jgi:trehalose 6-phosphate synthase